MFEETVRAEVPSPRRGGMMWLPPHPAVYAEEPYAVDFVLEYPLTSRVSRGDVVMKARVSLSGVGAGELVAVLVTMGFVPVRHHQRLALPGVGLVSWLSSARLDGLGFLPWRA